MKYKLIAVFFLVISFMYCFSSKTFAAEVTPSSNITNNLIDTRTFQIVLEYGNPVVLGETSNIQLYENGVLVDTSSSIVGTQVQINKATNYLEKKTYRIIVENIESSDPEITYTDVDLSFTYSSYKKFEIGRSVQGRRIWGYSLGEGSQVFMLIGSIHGNEKNTSVLVDKLMRNYMANPTWIPSDTKLVFVPILNMDGYVRNNRLNARGVDLNRNANTSDWQRVTYYGSMRIAGGGGTKPNSEPETRAIVNLIKQYQPFLTISYHSASGYALTNGSISRRITRYYASKVGYTYVDQSSGGIAFTYPITGDLMNWLYEKKGYKGITVELKSREWSEVSQNLRALKYIISIY